MRIFLLHNENPSTIYIFISSLIVSTIRIYTYILLAIKVINFIDKIAYLYLLKMFMYI